MKITKTSAGTTIDLTVMPEEQCYEDNYQKYMGVFKTVAETPIDEEVLVIAPPYSWVPLLQYLGAETLSGQIVFTHDPVVAAMIPMIDKHDRTLIEVICGFRPELVDALWKCDMQWETGRPNYVLRRDFIVTNNGSFHRTEVMGFMSHVDGYNSKAERCVIVPCAADKPYPSPMHKQVRSMIPDDWELCIATGVLGIVPESTWSDMPHYDSGIPNEWRLMNRAVDYFLKQQYETVIIYVDFYSLALEAAVDKLRMEGCPTKFIFVNPVRFYADYMNLMDEHHLNNLQEAIDLPQLLDEQEVINA